MLVCLCLAQAAASACAAAARSVQMQAFTRDAGLGSLAANALARDAEGVLWVGTDHGAYRFDGRRFRAVGDGAARALRVNDMFLAPDGRLWVGAGEGLYVQTKGGLRRMAAVPVADHRRIAADGAGGVYVRHQRRLVHIDAGGAVRDVAWPQALKPGPLTDGPVLWARDRLWTSCGTRLCTRGSHGMRVWGRAQGVPADHWITLHVAADGTLWVGGDHHLLRLAPGDRRFQAIASDAPVEMIAIDGEGRVLAARAGRIGRWDGRRWADIEDPRSLQSAQIRDLRFDPAGAVWLATGGRGVLRWRGYGRFQNWRGDQGLDSAPTWAIARDADGVLWLGNQRRGNRLLPGSARLTSWPRALRRPGWINVTALAPRGRRMWVVYNAGRVARYDLDTHRAHTVLAGAGWTKFGLFDAQGRLWVGTHGTLWRIDHADSDRPRPRRMATGLPPDTNYSGASLDPDGALWIATSHGLLRFADGRFTRLTRSSAMPAGGLADVAVDASGGLWLAPVAGGLWRAHADKTGTLAATPVPDALVRATRFYALAQDRDGRLWAASDAGIDLHADGAWRRLDQGDGLAWDDMATGFMADADGTIWLGTSGGVSHVLHPGGLLPAPTLRAPVILRASYGEAASHVRHGQTLAWSGKALDVDLATPGTTHAGDLRIQYRLAAYASWERATSRQLAFAALAPGAYRLEVRVIDPLLRRVSPSVTLALTVTPPWWRSDAATAGYAVAIGLMLWLAWRWRIAGMRRYQARLERQVAARTRDLEADKRDLQVAHRALSYEARHDGLTGLLNRGAAVERLTAMMQAPDMFDGPLAVVLIDLDHFKQVNDTHGHLTGDAVLVQCAQRFRALVPEGVALGRFGGEELLAAWPGLDPATDLARCFEPLLSGHYRDGDRQLRVTCSIGVAWARADDGVDSLLRRADDALYRAKQGGRARVERDGQPLDGLSTRSR